MYSSPNRRSNNEWTLPFMAWELRLYLDTHPEDEKALAVYKQLCAKLDGCVGACHTPTGQDPESSRWSWIDDPWPWQAEANVSDMPTQGGSEGEVL